MTKHLIFPEPIEQPDQSVEDHAKNGKGKDHNPIPSDVKLQMNSVLDFNHGQDTTSLVSSFLDHSHWQDLCGKSQERKHFLRHRRAEFSRVALSALCYCRMHSTFDPDVWAGQSFGRTASSDAKCCKQSKMFQC